MADTERTIRKRGKLSLPVRARLPRYNRVDDTSLVIASVMISIPNPRHGGSRKCQRWKKRVEVEGIARKRSRLMKDEGWRWNHTTPNGMSDPGIGRKAAVLKLPGM